MEDWFKDPLYNTFAVTVIHKVTQSTPTRQSCLFFGDVGP